MTFQKKIQTNRLSLSPIRWGDLLFFVRLIGNADVRRFLGGPVPVSARLPRFKAYRRENPLAGIWMVRQQASGRRVGIVELTAHKDGDDYEVSYQFHPTFWGNGFAREAVDCVLDHAFDDLGFVRVIAETQAANHPSCRLLEGLGFVELEQIERFGALQTLYVKQSGVALSDRAPKTI